MEGILDMVHQIQAWWEAFSGLDGELSWTGLQWVMAGLLLPWFRMALCKSVGVVWRSGPFSPLAMKIIRLMEEAPSSKSRWDADENEYKMTRGPIACWYRGRNRKTIKLNGVDLVATNQLTRRERKKIRKVLNQQLALLIASRRNEQKLLAQSSVDAAAMSLDRYCRDAGLAA